MANLADISSLATAFGTLILAVATFSSVRSGSRAARVAERSLLAGQRPLILTTTTDDPPLKVSFGDAHWVEVLGGHGSIEITDEAIYLTASLRNVGAGVAMLHSWDIVVDPQSNSQHYAPLDGFRVLQRDLYIATGIPGFWQGAIRDVDDPARQTILDAVAANDRILLDLHYLDWEGNQSTVTRIVLWANDKGPPLATAVRHWNVDGADRHDDDR